MKLRRPTRTIRITLKKLPVCCVIWGSEGTLNRHSGTVPTGSLLGYAKGSLGWNKHYQHAVTNTRTATDADLTTLLVALLKSLVSLLALAE